MLLPGVAWVRLPPAYVGGSIFGGGILTLDAFRRDLLAVSGGTSGVGGATRGHGSLSLSQSDASLVKGTPTRAPKDGERLTPKVSDSHFEQPPKELLTPLQNQEAS